MFNNSPIMFNVSTLTLYGLNKFCACERKTWCTLARTYKMTTLQGKSVFAIAGQCIAGNE